MQVLLQELLKYSQLESQKMGASVQRSPGQRVKGGADGAEGEKSHVAGRRGEVHAIIRSHTVADWGQNLGPGSLCSQPTACAPSLPSLLS